MRVLLPGMLLHAAAIAAPPSAAPAEQQAQEQPLTALPYTPSLDTSAMDRGADPCEDFYRYACGGWIAANPIPADEAGWSVFDKMDDDNQRFLWGLLQHAAEPRADRPDYVRKAGDYFAACMAADEGNGDAGAQPLREPLDAIDALHDKRALAPLLARLHALGAKHSLFTFTSQQNPGDATEVIALLDAGGLGLPDRDQYLQRDARSRALLRDYEAHVARTLALAGATPQAARAAARHVLAIETALARASLTRTERRDPHRLDHRMSLARLQRLAPHIDWPAYLAASGLASDAATVVINVAEPRFVRAVSNLITARPLAEWQDYLRWHLLLSQSPYLDARFAQEHFDFFDKRLQGVQAMPPRWKRCVQWADRDLGEALGRLFVDKTFSPQTKERVADMTRRIEAAMQQRIEALDWMSAPTKTAALAKLHAMVNKIGYPERWRDYSALEIKRDDFLGNVQRGLAFERARRLAKIGKPVDRGEWQMTPPTVNAYFDPQMNDINFPAGILQPPLFDPKLDDAPNYGDTGSTIGHELTHGFDDEGRQYDAQGNLRNWWTRKDAKAFEQRAACVAKQYSQYTIIDDIKINGRLTLGEDVADLGGTILAYAAWRDAVAGQTLPERDGLTPEQRFFVGFAQWACGSDRPERQRLLALTDPHSPPRYRVNGVVANMPEFAKAFACRKGQAMVRERVCRVW